MASQKTVTKAIIYGVDDLIRYVYCKNCGLNNFRSRALRMTSEMYDTKTKKHKRFSVGIYCQNCKTFEWAPSVAIKKVIGDSKSRF